MKEEEVLVLNGDEVAALLAEREAEIIGIVEHAYIAHRKGQSSLPHSSFLRFPDNDTDRVIALPAYLGDGFEVAGMKWVSSFPGNVEHGIARASAVLILNSIATGRPEAIMEGSLISARRTAASAASAARALLSRQAPDRMGLVGTGMINLEVARFLRVVFPEICCFSLFDLDATRADLFAAKLGESLGEVQITLAASLEEVLATSSLIAFATTAGRPHVFDLSVCPRGTVILHISLRDLAPKAVLDCDNVVDDPDHVCRAQTTMHLAEQAVGGRSFIRCTLADILQGTAPPRRGDDAISIFNPFGLGVLDIALGKRVLDWALASGRGTSLRFFA